MEAGESLGRPGGQCLPGLSQGSQWAIAQESLLCDIGLAYLVFGFCFC